MYCYIMQVDREGNPGYVGCEEIRDQYDILLDRFRANNRSEYVEKIAGIDRAYEEYKKEIDEFLKNCKCLRIKQDKQSLCNESK